MPDNIYLYILVMALVTYLVRMLPLTLLRREIKNVYIRSFLYYIPYATLAAMTFPAILYAASSIWSSLAGFLVALLLAYRGKGLVTVAIVACAAAFLVGLIPGV